MHKSVHHSVKSVTFEATVNKPVGVPERIFKDQSEQNRTENDHPSAGT